MANEVERAYLAGIIDGEGSISLSTNRKHTNCFTYSVTICNTSEELIEWVAERFGGHVYRDSRPTNPTSNRYGRKPIYQITWHNKQAISDLLVQIIDYLVIKKALAEALLLFCSLEKEKTAKRDALCQLCVSLNSLKEN